MKISLETKIQIDFVDWCKENLPNLTVIHIPNEGKRSWQNGHIQKRMGLLAGVPDTFIPELFLWIEFKGEGKLSKAQKNVISKLEKHYTVAVCYSAAEAIEVINNQLNKLDMFKITGRVMEIGQVQTGQSKSGNQWSKNHFVIETQGEYPKKLKFDVWGKSLEMLNGLQVGEMVDVDADAESRGWQDKWFTDLKAFRINKSTQPSDAPAPSYPAQQQTKVTSPPPAEDEPIDETLPF